MKPYEIILSQLYVFCIFVKLERNFGDRSMSTFPMIVKSVSTHNGDSVFNNWPFNQISMQQGKQQ